MINQVRLPQSRPTTRQSVARDTLIILAGALLAIGASKLVVPDPVGSLSSPPPGDTGLFIGVGSEAPPPTIPLLATVGQIVNPSVHLEATPTPIPIITLGPPTPTPSVGESTGPDGSSRPTAKPSVKPSTKPTPKPTPAPTKPPAGFTCIATATADELSCSATVVAVGSTYDWDWGDSANGSGPTDVHLYQQDGCFLVALTVTTPGGQVNSSSHVEAVSSSSPPPTC
jgi:hypothetical protein